MNSLNCTSTTSHNTTSNDMEDIIKPKKVVEKSKVSIEEWNDYKWQLRNRIETIEEL